METEIKKIHINPPPRDGKCHICGTHVDDLKPYGKEGDPLVGNFEGAKLVKTYRALAEEGSCPELDIIIQELDRLLKLNNGQWDEGIQITLEQQYGMKKVDDAFLYDQACNTVGPSWECRDCIIK